MQKGWYPAAEPIAIATKVNVSLARQRLAKAEVSLARQRLAKV